MQDASANAAGSLLEFTLADHSFSMPVGRIEYHHLGPMTFREFLQAVEPTLCRHLDDVDFDVALLASIRGITHIYRLDYMGRWVTLIL